MLRRGSIGLLGVALAALACGQMPTSTVPQTSAVPPSTPLLSGTPTQSAAPTAPSMTPVATNATPTDSAERGTWQAAAPMTRERQGFDAVLLGSGTVLAVGSDSDCHPGGAEPGSETAEAYDPVADQWFVVDSLNKPRKSPATVVLANGSALVLGGTNSEDVSFSSTKLLDDPAGAWANGPLLEYARGRPIAVALDDGAALVRGGAAAY